MTKYVLVQWPEIQDFMVHPRWDECYAGIDEGIYFVPEDLEEELNDPPDPEFIFDGQLFTRDFWEINRGDLVCFSNNKDKMWTSYCIVSGKGYMPDIFENGETPGIDCYIEGIKI